MKKQQIVFVGILILAAGLSGCTTWRSIHARLSPTFILETVLVETSDEGASLLTERVPLVDTIKAKNLAAIKQREDTRIEELEDIRLVDGLKVVRKPSDDAFFKQVASKGRFAANVVRVSLTGSGLTIEIHCWSVRDISGKPYPMNHILTETSCPYPVDVWRRNGMYNQQHWGDDGVKRHVFILTKLTKR